MYQKINIKIKNKKNNKEHLACSWLLIYNISIIFCPSIPGYPPVGCYPTLKSPGTVRLVRLNLGILRLVGMCGVVGLTQLVLSVATIAPF